MVLTPDGSVRLHHALAVQFTQRDGHEDAARLEIYLRGRNVEQRRGNPVEREGSASGIEILSEDRASASGASGRDAVTSASVAAFRRPPGSIADTCAETNRQD
jgi:hypothetical protein